MARGELGARKARGRGGGGLAAKTRGRHRRRSRDGRVGVRSCTPSFERTRAPPSAESQGARPRTSAPPRTPGGPASFLHRNTQAWHPHHVGAHRCRRRPRRGTLCRWAGTRVTHTGQSASKVQLGHGVNGSPLLGQCRSLLTPVLPAIQQCFDNRCVAVRHARRPHHWLGALWLPVWIWIWQRRGSRTGRGAQGLSPSCASAQVLDVLAAHVGRCRSSLRGTRCGGGRRRWGSWRRGRPRRGEAGGLVGGGAGCRHQWREGGLRGVWGRGS